MEITHPNFFRVARSVEKTARHAGLPPFRAFAISRVVAAGLSRARKQRLGLQLLALGDRRALLGKVGTPGHDDTHVSAAHRLLSQLEPDNTPNLASVRVLRLLGRDAYTVGGWIFMSSDSSFYHTTNLMGLAMLLHHEFFHITHPTATEPEVCAASLRFAEQCGPEHRAALVAAIKHNAPLDH